jgi:hypothetical protein
MLEYGVREYTPWDRVGCIVAKYMVRSDAERFVDRERDLQIARGCEERERLTYKIVRFKKASK